MQKVLKSIKIFQSYGHKCTASFLWFTVYMYIRLIFCNEIVLDMYLVGLKIVFTLSSSTNTREHT